MKISNLPDKDLCLKYGQTLMDFANAKSTDDAISLLFQNLHIVYELSDEYLKVAKTKFPLMSSIKKLSEEKSLYVKNIISLSELSAQISLYMYETYSFRLISIDINDSCLGVIDFKNIDIELKNFKYPCQKETIKYIQKYGRFGKNNIYLRETNRIIIIDNLKVNLGREKGGYLIEEVHKRIMFADLNKKKYPEFDGCFFLLFTDFLNAAETLKIIIEKIPEKKINEYNELAHKWNSILIAHDLIKSEIHTLKDQLFKISKGHTIKVFLERYLRDYNQYFGPKLELTNDDSFKIKIYQPNEKRCSLETLRFPELYWSLNIIFSHLIVSFFSNFNPKKVKKCPYCNLFYIAKDIKRKRCYSLECQKEFEKQKKRTQREREPQIYS